MLSWLSGHSTSPRSWNLNCSEQATVQPIAQNMIQKVKTVMQSHHQKSTKDHSSCSKDAHKLVTQVIKYVLVQIEHFQYCEELSVAKNPSLEHLAQAANHWATATMQTITSCTHCRLPVTQASWCPGFNSWQLLAFHFPHLPHIYHKCSSGQCKTIL